MIIIIDHLVSKSDQSVEQSCLRNIDRLQPFNLIKNNTINCYFIDGSIKKVAPFKYHPKRNIGDQFMNVNNDIATTVLG